MLLCVLVWSGHVVAEEPDFTGFDAWLEKTRADAIAAGISEATVDAAFAGLEPDPRVIGFDRRQPEFTQTFEQYLTARVTESRIRMAREFLDSEADLLARIGDHYGVEPQYIVSFWGLESAFGRIQGKYSVIRSVATLAFDPRRTTFFTNQLMDALRILDEGHITPEKFVGGWAGAMGQNQFIPSSFLAYAQDFDGDGRKNIWSSRADVFASIAYYLKKNGWKEGAGWGLPATLPAGFQTASLMPESTPRGCRAFRHHTSKRSVADWQSMGVTPASEAAGEHALLVPDEGELRSYLVRGNFSVILRYNCANKYAVSVGLLADAALGE